MTFDTNHISGYLKVKGTWGSSSKYWFVLKGNTLARFKTPKDNVPHETMDLSNKNISVMNAEGITGKKLTIGIFVASKSPIIIIAETQEEFSCWLEKLQAAGTKDVGHKDSTESIVATMEAVLDASVVADEKCNICGFNKAAETLFGYTKQEILGKNVKLLMPDAYANVHDKYISNYHKTGHKKLIGMPRQLIAKKKDGSTTPVHVSLGEIAQHKTGECKAAFVALIRNVTLQHSNPDNSPKYGLQTTTPDSTPILGASATPVLRRSDSDDSIASLEFNLDKDGTPIVASRRASVDTASHNSALNHDFGVAIKKVERRMNEKILEAMQSLQASFKEELEDLDKKYLVSQHKNDILETENKRLNSLVGTLTDDNTRLQDELKMLQKSSDKWSILQVLRKNSTYLSFLGFCQQRKSPEPAMFYNEAELYRTRFASMNPDEAKKEAANIFKKYLEEGSPFQLNTRSVLTDFVKKHLVDPSQNLFAILQDEVVNELNHQLYKEFLTTAQGKYALAELETC